MEPVDTQWRLKIETLGFVDQRSQILITLMRNKKNRVRIKVKSRIWIRIKMKRGGRIRITVMRDMNPKLLNESSVADPRLFIPDPGSGFFHPGPRAHKPPDPRSATLN